MTGRLIYRYILHLNVIFQRHIEHLLLRMLLQPLRIEFTNHTIPLPPILSRIPHRHILRPDHAIIIFNFLLLFRQRQLINIRLINIPHKQSQRHIQHLSRSSNNLQIIRLKSTFTFCRSTPIHRTNSALDFYNDEPLTEKTFELLKDLLNNLSDLYSISDMIIDNETYRRDARKRRRIVAG